MALALSIVLSALVIGAVALYSWNYLRANPGRNWRKGLAAIGVNLIALFAVAGVMLAYRHYESRPATQTQYQGVSLGMGMDEVLRVLGEPSLVVGDDASPPRKEWIREMRVADLRREAQKADVKDYLEWRYENESSAHRIDVSFSPKTRKVLSIGCYANRGVSGECAVLGITSGMLEEDVLRRLGKPEHERVDGTVKFIDYPRLNLTLAVSQRMVYLLSVTAPEDR